MKFLRLIWNFSFDSLDKVDVFLKTIMYVLSASIFTIVSFNISGYFWLRLVFYIITPIVDLYVFIGLIILYLNFLKIIK